MGKCLELASPAQTPAQRGPEPQALTPGLIPRIPAAHRRPGSEPCLRPSATHTEYHAAPRPGSPRTSDKQEGAVVGDPPPGHDPQGVEPLIILVEVAEGERGLAFSEEHLGPLGLFQQHVCKTGKETGLRDTQGPGASGGQCAYQDVWRTARDSAHGRARGGQRSRQGEGRTVLTAGRGEDSAHGRARGGQCAAEDRVHGRARGGQHTRQGEGRTVCSRGQGAQQGKGRTMFTQGERRTVCSRGQGAQQGKGRTMFTQGERRTVCSRGQGAQQGKGRTMFTQGERKTARTSG